MQAVVSASETVRVTAGSGLDAGPATAVSGETPACCGRQKTAMPRKYRIAHVITRLDLGGAQQNTLFCARHHDRARFDVELLAGRGGMLDEEARTIPGAEVRILSCLRHEISPRFLT